MKRTVCRGATDDEFQLFLGVCQRTNLDPFARQIYSIERKTWNSSTKSYDVTRSIQTGIDGFRVIAERTREVDGQEGPFWCGPDGIWKDVWLDSNLPPVAARVVIHRKGAKLPFVGVARFDAYAQFYKDGNEWKLTQMWNRMGDVMIAKCAEALALRKAFPMQLGELRTTDEMAQAENPERLTIEDQEKNANAKVIEAGGKVETFAAQMTARAASQSEAIVKEGVESSTRSAKEDWRKVKCHVGTANGPMLGKTVGEMVPAVIEWFKKEWLPKLPEQPLKKDAALRDALRARIAANLPEDAPQSPETPPEDQTTVQTPQKPTGGAASAKAGPATVDVDIEKLPAKPIAWREIVLELPQSKALHGRKLEKIAMSEKGEMTFEGASGKAAETCAAADGSAWLRMLVVQGIPVIEKRNLGVKDKILVNAILAAAAEMKAFDDPEWRDNLDETGARKEIRRRFTAAGVSEEAANEHTKGSTGGKTIDELDASAGIYLLQNWSDVEALIQAVNEEAGQ